MADKSEQQGQAEGLPEVHTERASKALSTALQKTFEALLEEPVPEKFQALIDRIRAEEMRRSAQRSDNDNES